MKAANISREFRVHSAVIERIATMPNESAKGKNVGIKSLTDSCLDVSMLLSNSGLKAMAPNTKAAIALNSSKGIVPCLKIRAARPLSLLSAAAKTRAVKMPSAITAVRM